MSIKNYDEIMSIRSEGLCESCDYGFDNCLKDGKAFCKTSKEMIINGEKESV